MSKQLRTVPILAATFAVLAFSGITQAGPMGDVIREARGGREGSDESSAEAPRQRAPRQSAPEPPRANDRVDRGDRGNRGDQGNRGSREEGRAPPRFARTLPPVNDTRPPSVPAVPSGNMEQRRGNRGAIGNVIERNFARDDRHERDDRRNGDHYGNRRPPRYVSNLPGGYRQYDWGGRSYYHHSGQWYRPYGNRYVVVGAPFGLFVNYLPSYYSSFWFGNTRYFYADDTYYTYEPVRRGYVVSRSPYGDDYEDEYSSSSDQDEDLYVYPARGQSEQQQADDRYQCHRWAADQTRYDPIDSDYDADRREDYLRAMTACLTGRGYSVK